MRGFLRFGLLLSLFLVLILSLVSCDSGGSSSSPDWTGSWEITETADGDSPSEDTAFLDLDTNQFNTIAKGSSGCTITSSDVLEQDGNVVKLNLPKQNGSERFKLDVSSGTLTMTVIESDASTLSSGDEITAVSVDRDPREIAGCS
jgi:hypothetical protein